MLFWQSNLIYHLLLLSVPAIGTQRKQMNFDKVQFIIPLVDPLGEKGEGLYEKDFS